MSSIHHLDSISFSKIQKKCFANFSELIRLPIFSVHQPVTTDPHLTRTTRITTLITGIIMTAVAAAGLIPDPHLTQTV
jgi:hypothetical protein